MTEAINRRSAVYETASRRPSRPSSGRQVSTACGDMRCKLNVGERVCFTVARVQAQCVHRQCAWYTSARVCVIPWRWCTASVYGVPRRTCGDGPYPLCPSGHPFTVRGGPLRVQIILLISRELVAAKSCRPCSPPRDPESRPCTPSCDVVAVAGASRERQRPSTPLQVRFHPSKSPGTGATLPGCSSERIQAELTLSTSHPGDSTRITVTWSSPVRSLAAHLPAASPAILSAQVNMRRQWLRVSPTRGPLLLRHEPVKVEDTPAISLHGNAIMPQPPSRRINAADRTADPSSSPPSISPGLLPPCGFLTAGAPFPHSPTLAPYGRQPAGGGRTAVGQMLRIRQIESRSSLHTLPKRPVSAGVGRQEPPSPGSQPYAGQRMRPLSAGIQHQSTPAWPSSPFQSRMAVVPKGCWLRSSQSEKAMPPPPGPLSGHAVPLPLRATGAKRDAPPPREGHGHVSHDQPDEYGAAPAIVQPGRRRRLT